MYDHTIAPYDVLVRRGQDPVDVPYWKASPARTPLSAASLDVSSYDDLGSCSDSSECGTFLRLDAPSKDWSGRVSVPLRLGPQTVFVRFDAGGAKRVYTISLDRLWSGALPFAPRIGSSIPAGWKAKLIRGKQPDGVLY